MAGSHGVAVSARCPVSEMSDVEFKMGGTGPTLGRAVAGMVRWGHLSCPGDVLAYRVVDATPTAPTPIKPLRALELDARAPMQWPSVQTGCAMVRYPADGSAPEIIDHQAWIAAWNGE